MDDLSEYLHDNVGRFVRLRRSGQQWVSLCPFHHEETPSFTLNPSSNTYHCFGCEAHGHVEDFEAEFRDRNGQR